MKIVWGLPKHPAKLVFTFGFTQSNEGRWEHKIHNIMLRWYGILFNRQFIGFMVFEMPTIEKLKATDRSYC